MKWLENKIKEFNPIMIASIDIIENKTMSGYTYKKKRESGDGCIRFYTATSERELIDVIRYR